MNTLLVLAEGAAVALGPLCVLSRGPEAKVAHAGPQREVCQPGMLLRLLCSSVVLWVALAGCTGTSEGGAGGVGAGGIDGGNGGQGGVNCCKVGEVDRCDDDDPCTRDVCGDRQNCEFLAGCVDHNECTVDTCNEGIGCEFAPVQDGTACGGGMCEAGECALTGTVLPCSEEGVRNATAAGGGPYTFDCAGPTTVVTEAPIEIANDVILDGQGNLIVDGNGTHRVFVVPDGVSAELIGIGVTGGYAFDGAGIQVSGELTLRRCVVFGNSSGPGCFGCGGAGGASCPHGGGIDNEGGEVTLFDSLVTANRADIASGIRNRGVMTIQNSTVSGNDSESGAAIRNTETMTIAHSTVSNGIDLGRRSEVEMFGTIVEGECSFSPVSTGYNLESPGDTCDFSQPTDQAGVSAEALRLGPLADNGGPTETRALEEGSTALDAIPELECAPPADQRGLPRDSMCDVGAFELQR